MSVSVSPERLVKKAERTEAEMASIHRALRELEEAVAEGEPFSYADEVDAQSAEIAECQHFWRVAQAKQEQSRAFLRGLLPAGRFTSRPWGCTNL